MSFVHYLAIGHCSPTDIRGRPEVVDWSKPLDAKFVQLTLSKFADETMTGFSIDGRHIEVTPDYIRVSWLDCGASSRLNEFCRRFALEQDCLLFCLNPDPEVIALDQLDVDV